MTTHTKTVAVTGSSGYIGAKLLEHLEETPDVGRLVTFDLKPMPAPIHNIAAFREDIATPIDEELTRYGADVVVHLAFVRRSGSNRRADPENREKNQEMLRSVLASCVMAGVGHFIYLSSHTVYGARSNNPLPIGEDSTLNPSPGFAYALDHLQAERALVEFSQAMPETKLTILRSCPVLGSRADYSLIRDLYFGAAMPLLEHNPPLQFVHDDDLARVLCLAIARELTGSFNVAGDGVVFLRELADSLSVRHSPLPAPIPQLFNRTIGGVAAADDNGLAKWPVIMSTGKLKRATGYRFRHTGLDAVSAFASSREEGKRRSSKKVEICVGESSHLPTIVVHEDS